MYVSVCVYMCVCGVCVMCLRNKIKIIDNGVTFSLCDLLNTILPKKLNSLRMLFKT